MCRAVVLKLERAFASAPGARSLVVGGGVSANSRLREELGALATRRGVALRIPEMRYCVDNGAMIAGLGAVLLGRGERAGLDLEAVPTTAC